MKRLRHFWWGVFCAIVFFFLGWLFVDKPGIEQDEAIFATPFFRDWCFYALPLGSDHRLPLMHMSYLGALKTWLYTPVFWLWPASPASIRIPAIILGSATIVLFWLLLDRVNGRRAAFAGCILLVTDTIFLLTTTLDWGPVALQHLLTVGAMLLAIMWYQTGRQSFLAAAAFCCGLAFWDKAVFGWIFIGLCAGSLLFAKGIRQRMTARSALLAIAAFVTGALPVIVYNLAGDPTLSTLRSNSHFTLGALRPGLSSLRTTWNGSVLFDITHDTAPQPNPPEGVAQEVCFSVHSMSGDRRTNLVEPALLAALLLVPLLWRTPARNPIVFALVATVVGWTFMLVSGGGLSAHHTILLWPLPIFFLAIALGEASMHVRFGHGLLVAAVCLLAASNFLVTNQYLYQFVRFGSADAWTDAIYPLAVGLRKTHASQVVLPDWGMADQLCVLNRNDPPAHWVAFPFMPPGDPPNQRKADLDILADDKAIWVEHTPDHEVFRGANERVFEAARQAGFSPVMLGDYYDRYGRAIFRSFRFRRVQ